MLKRLYNWLFICRHKWIITEVFHPTLICYLDYDEWIDKNNKVIAAVHKCKICRKVIYNANTG